MVSAKEAVDIVSVHPQSVRGCGEMVRRGKQGGSVDDLSGQPAGMTGGEENGTTSRSGKAITRRTQTGCARPN